MSEVRVVAAAIVRDGRVLVARRGPGRLEGAWELPGGKVEPGEGDREALRREIHEELGLSVAVLEHLEDSVHVYGHGAVRLVAWSCAVEGGELALTAHSEIRWCGPEELPALDWAPADVPLLPAVIRALGPLAVHRGEGLDVLALHGFTGTGADFAGLAAVAPDLPGHGGSYGPPTMDGASDALAALPPAVVLGYSMGGRLALHHALRHPEKVRGLVLVGASPGLADPDERAARRAADEALADRIERMGVAAFAPEWEAQPLLARDRTEAERARRRAQRASGLAASLRGMGTGAMEPLWERLGAVRGPTWLVTGARDAKFGATAAAMAARMPDARLVVIEGAGHAPHLEAPDAFRRALADAL